MKLSDRFRKLLEGMPDEASVTLPVTTLRAWLDESGPGGFDPDLTVKEVAQRFSRSEVTIRGWIRDGLLRAYKFRGREYRIPSSALIEFQDQEAGRKKPDSRPGLVMMS